MMFTLNGLLETDEQVAFRMGEAGEAANKIYTTKISPFYGILNRSRLTLPWI